MKSEHGGVTYDTGLNSSSRSSCRLFSANKKTRKSRGRPCLQGLQGHTVTAGFCFFLVFIAFFFKFRRRVLRLGSEMLPGAACKYLPRTLQQSPADRGLKGRGAESVCVAPAVISARRRRRLVLACCGSPRPPQTRETIRCSCYE